MECDQQPAAEQQPAEQQQVGQDKVEPLLVAQKLVGRNRGDEVERNAREKRQQEVFSLQHSRIQEQGDK